MTVQAVREQSSEPNESSGNGKAKASAVPKGSKNLSDYITFNDRALASTWAGTAKWSGMSRPSRDHVTCRSMKLVTEAGRDGSS